MDRADDTIQEILAWLDDQTDEVKLRFLGRVRDFFYPLLPEYHIQIQFWKKPLPREKKA